jgi:hypothetical protein
VRFFFPDSQDQIDPYFNFQSETTAEFRVRQRDDRYAHEVLSRPAYDGVLVSKAIVDGLAGTSGKYTMAQRHRLYRLGARRFFRLDQPGWDLVTMGDCGAFTYVREAQPPYSVAEVLDFYNGCGFDYGISIDHVIFGWDPHDQANELPEWKRRQSLSLQLAGEFLEQHARRECRFIPIGAAQGWSPDSYAASVYKLQEMGYQYIALGGMVPLKTPQILESLQAIEGIRNADVQLHLLGVSRPTLVSELAEWGVASLDSTTPFRQAFKDDRDNYYWWDRNYSALRVPQIDGNPKLKAAIRAGRVDQATARRLERSCLEGLREYDAGRRDVDDVVSVLHEYGQLHGDKVDRRGRSADLLRRRPWRECECEICKSAGIDVIIFRGTERNKRRGFHNLHIFKAKLDVKENSLAKARRD